MNKLMMLGILLILVSSAFALDVDKKEAREQYYKHWTMPTINADLGRWTNPLCVTIGTYDQHKCNYFYGNNHMVKA